MNEVITRKHIKLFSGKVSNSLGMKTVEKEFYKWVNEAVETSNVAFGDNTSIDIQDIKMSTHNGFLYMLVYYITITITVPENPDALKPVGPLKERFSSFSTLTLKPFDDYTKENMALNSFKDVPDKSVVPPEPDVGKGEY